MRFLGTEPGSRFKKCAFFAVFELLPVARYFFVL